jgi:hypothetical protein
LSTKEKKVLFDRRLFLYAASGAAIGTGLHFSGWLSNFSSPEQDDAAITERARRMSGEHGVTIAYGSPDRFFVAPYTQVVGSMRDAKAAAVELVSLPRALDGIEHALAAYPPGFVARLCKAIFICGELTYDGVDAGGTYGPIWIVLVAHQKLGAKGIYDTARLGVHHEFSSLIWQKLDGLRARWATLMPQSGWNPAATSADALRIERKNGAVQYEQGFLSLYGATSNENDLNTYAEIAFTDPQRIVRLAELHSLIARKAGLLMQAYERIDKRMVDVFEKLGLGRLRDPRPLPESEINVSPVEIPQGRVVK